MASAKQRAANRRNAQKSTGPKTAEGKAHSAQNARTHGLASSTVRLSSVDQPRYDRLQRELRAQYLLVGAREEVAFEAILNATWRLIEVREQEEMLFQTRDEEGNPINLFADPVYGKAIDRCRRYQLHHQRIFDRAEKQLRDLQKERIEKQANGLGDQTPVLLTARECYDCAASLDPAEQVMEAKPAQPKPAGSEATKQSQFSLEEYFSEQEKGADRVSEQLLAELRKGI